MAEIEEPRRKTNVWGGPASSMRKRSTDITPEGKYARARSPLLEELRVLRKTESEEPESDPESTPDSKSIRRGKSLKELKGKHGRKRRRSKRR